jgi:hypothetical protein
MLAVDGGTTFVNYLDLLEWDVEQSPLSLAFLDKHKKLIEDNLAKYEPGGVHDKYRWLAAYHDWFLESFAGGPLAEQAADLKIDHHPALATNFAAFGHDIPAPLTEF